MALLESVIVEEAELQSQLLCAAAGAGRSLVIQPLSWSPVCLRHSQPEKNVKTEFNEEFLKRKLERFIPDWQGILVS